MSDKELLKTIQKDIKNLNKCIEMCNSDEGIDYLKSIQKDMRKQEIKLVKEMAIKKALKEQHQWTIKTHLHTIKAPFNLLT